MFTIIGGDGREYGPATVEQVRVWITSGRANLDTKAKALGSDEWRRLGDYLEFSSPGRANLDTRARARVPDEGRRLGDSLDFPPPAPPPPLGGVPPPMSSAAPAIGGGPELAGRGARIGGALLNALFYFLLMMPGSM